MKLKSLLWMFFLLLPAQLFGQYAGKVYDEGGAVYNVLAPNFGLAPLLCNGTDDTSALQNLMNAVSAAGGGIIQFSPTNHYCLISGQLTVPSNIHLRGCGPGANGQFSGTTPMPACGLDMQYSGGGYKMSWTSFGSGSIVDMAIVDSGSDCSNFALITNATMWIERTLWQGTHSALPSGSPCNDAITMGSPGGFTGYYEGYNGNILNNWFDKIRVAVKEGKNANSINVSNNMVSKTCGNTGSNWDLVGAAFEAMGSSPNTTGGSFSNNAIEMTSYQYGIYLGVGASGFTLIGNACWDPPVNAQNPSVCYEYASTAVNNLGILGFYQEYNMLGSNDTTSGNNQTLDPLNRHHGSFSHVAYNKCWGSNHDSSDVSSLCEQGVQQTSITDTMVTAPPLGVSPYHSRYRFSFAASLSDPGSCSHPSSLVVTLSYTDSDSGVAISNAAVVGLYGSSGSVTNIWAIPTSLDVTSAFRSIPLEFSAKAGTNVAFNATYTPDSSCGSNKPKYAFYPHLEQLP